MFQYNFSGIIYFMLFTIFYVENFIIKLIFSLIFLPMNSHKFHWIFVFAPHTFSWNLNVVKKLVILRICKGVWCTAIIILCDTFEFFSRWEGEAEVRDFYFRGRWEWDASFIWNTFDCEVMWIIFPCISLSWMWIEYRFSLEKNAESFV